MLFCVNIKIKIINEVEVNFFLKVIGSFIDQGELIEVVDGFRVNLLDYGILLFLENFDVSEKFIKCFVFIEQEELKEICFDCFFFWINDYLESFIVVVEYNVFGIGMCFFNQENISSDYGYFEMVGFLCF